MGSYTAPLYFQFVNIIGNLAKTTLWRPPAPGPFRVNYYMDGNDGVAVNLTFSWEDDSNFRVFGDQLRSGHLTQASFNARIVPAGPLEVQTATNGGAHYNLFVSVEDLRNL